MYFTFEYKWRKAFRHVSFHTKRSQADHFHWAIDNETLHTLTRFSYSDLYCFDSRCKLYNRAEAIKPCIILNNTLTTNLTPRDRKNFPLCLTVNFFFCDDVSYHKFILPSHAVFASRTTYSVLYFTLWSYYLRDACIII